MLRGKGYRVKFNWVVFYCFQFIKYYLMLVLYPGKTDNLNRFERKVFSQNGEDGLIDYIFRKIGNGNKYFVEIGAGSGKENNSRFLKKKGWKGLQIDSQKSRGVLKYFVTAENVEKILAENRVPERFDLLSIDIDGMDYWIWKAITNYQPRVVIVEYNASILPGEKLVAPYQPNFIWDGTTFFGASLEALNQLAQEKGYRLVCTNSLGINAFFVRKELAGKIFKTEVSLEKLYHQPKYRLQPDGSLGGHPNSNRMYLMLRLK